MINGPNCDSRKILLVFPPQMRYKNRKLIFVKGLFVQTIRSESFDVSSRLSQFGLSEEVLLHAVARGSLARAECTPNHPGAFAGYTAWGWTVAAMREGLLPLGWTRSEEGNFSVTVHPGKRMAIAVATGDENTGDPNSTPMTKSSKGPNTVHAVAINHAQQDLFESLNLQDQTGEEDDTRLTWLLLVSSQNGRVRSELSLPITCNGKVDGWKERIILSDLGTDPEVSVKQLPHLPDLPDIEIPIQRRTS